MSCTSPAPERRLRGTRIRRSKSGPRRAIALTLVHVLIALHVAHWASTGSSISPLEPSEAMHFTKDGIVNAGLVFFGAAILATALFGRWFCGWGCHLVALQDLCRWMLAKVGIRPRPLRSRLLLFVPALAFFYMFLYPLAYRLWHGLGFQYRGTELTTTSFWETFPPWPIALLTFLISGFILVYFLGAKGFCTYACPYGAIFGVVDRIAPGRIRVTDACEGCGHCTAVCSSNVEVHAEVRDYGAVIDPGCMKCLDCVSVCPNGALYFGVGPPALLTRLRAKRRKVAPAKPRRREKLARWRQLGLGEELLLAALFAGAFLTFRGLYGMVPFLFSLAIAGVVAFLGLQTARLFHRPNVSLQQLTLKAAGRLTGSGRVYAGAMLLFACFWAHSATIRYQAWRLDADWIQAVELRRARLQAPDAPLAPDARERMERALRRARLLERHALFDDPRAPLRSATFHLLLGDVPEYERRMRAALERAPRDASLHAALADHHASSGRPEAAFEHYERAITLDPGDAVLQQRYAFYALQLGALDRAPRAIEAALALHPDHPRLLFTLGVVHGERGDAPEAVELFRRAVAADPSSVPARENLSLGLKYLGRHAEALTELEELLALHPDLEDPRFQAADSAARLGEYDRAESHLRALEHAPTQAAQAWGLVGAIARERGDRQRAAAFFARALELDPSLAREE